MSNYKPILFQSEMVRAILEGRKIQDLFMPELLDGLRMAGFIDEMNLSDDGAIDPDDLDDLVEAIRHRHGIYKALDEFERWDKMDIDQWVGSHYPDKRIELG